MWPYWLFFLVPAMAALGARPNLHFRPDGNRKLGLNMAWLLTLLALTLIIGLRYQVGGDWQAYLDYFESASNMTYTDAALSSDPGYWLINVFAHTIADNIAVVNLIAGFAFSIGVIFFCRGLVRPWLALAVAFPYLIVVVGMGYSRQGVALGLAMVGLVALNRGRLLWFIFWVFLGATFHKTAVILIPIAGLVLTKNRWLMLPLIALLSLGAYTALLEDSVDQLVEGYIDVEMQSAGALIRLGMNFLPAAAFLLMRDRFRISENERRLWTIFSLLSIAAFVGFFAGAPSTALDRIALYLLPLQLVVFANLPDIVGVPFKKNTNIVFGIVSYYAAVLFVWLNFGVMSFAWVPYRMFPS